MWIVQRDDVAPRIDQRHVGIRIDRMDLAVHFEVYPSHGWISPFVALVGRKEGAFARGLAEDLDHSKPRPTPVPLERGLAPCGETTRLTELERCGVPLTRRLTRRSRRPRRATLGRSHR